MPVTVNDDHRAQVIKTVRELLALNYRVSRKDYLDKTAVLIHDIRVALDIPLDAILDPVVSAPPPVTPLESELQMQTQIP